MGRSWDLSWVKKVCFPHVFQCFLKIHFFEKVRCQEATWAELRPKWAPKREPKWSPRGSQDGAKKEKKNEVKLREVKSAKEGVKGKRPGVVTRPLEEEGETHQEILTFQIYTFRGG